MTNSFPWHHYADTLTTTLNWQITLHPMKIFTSNNFNQFFLLNCPKQTTCIFKTTTHNITTKINMVQHSSNPNCKRNMNQKTTITTKQQHGLLNQTTTVAIITYIFCYDLYLYLSNICRSIFLHHKHKNKIPNHCYFSFFITFKGWTFLFPQQTNDCLSY